MNPAKKRFGQHFLRDKGTLDRLTRLIQPAKGDFVIEIGAGEGAVSARVAPLVSRFVAVEIDTDRIAPLQELLAPWAHAAVIHGDILDLDWSPLMSEAEPGSLRTRIIGNLPYNIATAVIQKSLRLKAGVHDMVYMVQSEVADRIIAAPGSRSYGYLSIDCQHRARVDLAFKVSPACFVPRPRVMSAVVTFLPLGVDPSSLLDIRFDDIVKAAFAHRRKTLANSLRRHPRYGPSAVDALSKAGIDGGRRPEALSIDEYEKLTRAFLDGT
jgi:16S rRNA (adenine1518-N6/adenine1519-N6)-dimethyltransferase